MNTYTVPCYSMVTWYINKGVHLVSNFAKKSYQLARRISSHKILNVTVIRALTAPVERARLLEVSIQQT